MARIRTIKPEFWTDGKTGRLSSFAQCLFLACLNHADDYGVIPWDPDEWRVRMFPYLPGDECSAAIVAAARDELFPVGLWAMFSITGPDGEDSKHYVFIRNFPRHQLVNKPSKPLIAGWKRGDTPDTYALREHSNTTTGALLYLDQTTTTPVREYSPVAQGDYGTNPVGRKEGRKDIERCPSTDTELYPVGESLDGATNARDETPSDDEPHSALVGRPDTPTAGARMTFNHELYAEPGHVWPSDKPEPAEPELSAPLAASFEATTGTKPGPASKPLDGERDDPPEDPFDDTKPDGGGA